MFSSLCLSTEACEIRFTSTALSSIIDMPSIKPVYDSIALRRIGVRLNSTLFTPDYESSSSGSLFPRLLYSSAPRTPR
jgi:hypothetical protein